MELDASELQSELTGYLIKFSLFYYIMYWIVFQQNLFICTATRWYWWFRNRRDACTMVVWDHHGSHVSENRPSVTRFITKSTIIPLLCTISRKNLRTEALRSLTEEMTSIKATNTLTTCVFPTERTSAMPFHLEKVISLMTRSKAVSH